MNQTKPIIIFLFLLLGATLACTVPTDIGSTSPQDTPTPLGDTLTYNIPAYTYNLSPGEYVPGTKLLYVGQDGNAFEVTIDGLRAVKRRGDSFIWEGILAPGVTGNYNLRITTAVLGGLPVAGPVELTVFNPNPTERDREDTVNATLEFQNIIINYWIPEGRQIPGTPLIYEGITSQSDGANLAVLSGLSGYPYLALGDSLSWRGDLRSNVIIDYNLRVGSINDEGLRLAGTATLWIE